MHRQNISLYALLALSACSASASETAGPLTTVGSIDVPRYMGTWYEIAKYPNQFQKKCLSNTRADYSTQASGTVRVVNRCATKEGEVSEAIGEARQIGNSTSPKLEVRFAPAWTSFLPFVWGNYWVIDLDPAYQLVAVSEPKREYLWILSRTPDLTPKDYSDLIVRLQKKGFDTSKLERTAHGK